MQSLLHNTTHTGFTTLHFAAQEGHAEMVQFLIDGYKLNHTARTKVCGQSCRYLVMSSIGPVVGCAMHVGGVHVTDVCEHEQKLRQVH